LKTLDLNELDIEAVKKRVEYLKTNIEDIKNIPNEHIANYISVVQREKNVDILMEYVPGGSLRFILDNFVKFKEKLVRSYTKQILEGLKACHDIGICHGDLKVSNLLIDDLGIVKISDFGFIKQVLNNTSKVGYLKSYLKLDEETKEDDFKSINLPK